MVPIRDDILIQNGDPTRGQRICRLTRPRANDRHQGLDLALLGKHRAGTGLVQTWAPPGLEEVKRAGVVSRAGTRFFLIGSPTGAPNPSPLAPVSQAIHQ